MITILKISAKTGVKAFVVWDDKTRT